MHLNTLRWSHFLTFGVLKLNLALRSYLMYIDYILYEQPMQFFFLDNKHLVTLALKAVISYTGDLFIYCSLT